MKRVMRRFGLVLTMALTVVLTISLLSITALEADVSRNEDTVVPVEYTLSVDGTDFSLWAYELGGDPYFKMRDLAMALNGTEKQFEVEWDGERNEVNLYPDTSYTPVGGELSKPVGTGPAAAALNTSFFWYNSLSSYVIDDDHYIRLSDLAVSLRFSASCDDETHTAVIDTSDDTINVPKSTGRAEPINNIALMDVGYSWTVNGEGHVVLSYGTGNGEAAVVTPAVIRVSDYDTYADHDTYPGVYLSKQKTAIAYGGTGLTPLYVICSDDKGKTWSDPVLIQNSVGVSSLYIGFVTKDDGYLAVGNFHGMGYEDNFVYRTVDGGQTWMQIGNPNELYARMLTGAGFANDEIGFLGFRFEFGDFSPAICRTTDGGQTWEKLYVELPAKFDEYYSKTPLSPVFNGADGVLPIECMNHAGTTITIYLTSEDYGMTWTYNEA